MINPENKPGQRRIQRGRHGGWQPSEVALLSQAVENARVNGTPLRSVFDQVAAKTGRKANSVRNYFYATLPSPARSPFKPFENEEIEQLIRGVLSAKADGLSVRNYAMHLGQGDKKAMLRYQNKYRSLVKRRPDLVRQVVSQLRAQGTNCPDPTYAASPKMKAKTTAAPAALAPRETYAQQLVSALNRLPGADARNLLNLYLQFTDLFIRHARGYRRVEEYDALAARHDLLLIENQTLEQRCARLEALMDGQVAASMAREA